MTPQLFSDSPHPLVGWSHPSDSESQPFGFGRGGSFASDATILPHQRDSHILTIAPTGAGKGRSAVVPTLLTYTGPIFCIDIKGENAQIAAARRRAMGHEVVILDPFQILGPNSEGLNPLDLLSLPESDADSDSETLAELVTGGINLLSRDPFWDLSAKGMLTGLIGWVMESTAPDSRHLGTMLDRLYADDSDYHIAVALDTLTFQNPLTRQELVAYLSHEKERCRPSVRSTAQSFVKALGSRVVRQALAKTTFDLTAWARGEAIDIFLVFPPDKLDSHRALLRLWFGTLCMCLLRRRQMPRERTIMLLDEAAQLGSLPLLRTGMTLMRGYGVQLWTFWQDLAQLKQLYPTDWETILNNSGVVQLFGFTNHWMARSCAEIAGIPSHELFGMHPDDQVLMMTGEDGKIVRRLDYLQDSLFQGLFQPNPRYAKLGSRGR
ncbi:type IV secretory system conjugative DNA transfer family protein [Tuwongella immobilis]|uniref:TraD/TraG TraM recognition site domain-containing protein n=1 Tax=Tuwongella immobilis TaxID=692036 RepID=A0A6C2YLW4_9BACT|nr:type IV secretory system conjugative DNA transfer family protein [Tuwongella immobilis]VIP02219.1 family protein : Uncharacterized protein OS=Erythrobacter sp. SD-21 GN=ED21_17657 PE=4 SV=1: T4SS-DNA_transf [Tuwongella immobilis]VTS00744.1 family protein : Uncharacterized protein OS=Erythrobacter sp. SD-21 GN=ED21_17657 PE=4 SV=1: T4SS-DNA_transf [Tuwongella immobilis]